MLCSSVLVVLYLHTCTRFSLIGICGKKINLVRRSFVHLNSTQLSFLVAFCKKKSMQCTRYIDTCTHIRAVHCCL